MIVPGEYLGRGRNKKRVLEVIPLSNGWVLAKTENSKSERDYKVRTIVDVRARKFYTPKHAHFAIDFYGKLCQNKEKAKKVLEAIIEVWQGLGVEKALAKYEEQTDGLVGYELDYILYALKWILEQENINFKGRPDELQRKLDDKCDRFGINVSENNKGSQLAISLFCDIAVGVHPVEALLSANLDIVPRFRG